MKNKISQIAWSAVYLAQSKGIGSDLFNDVGNRFFKFSDTSPAGSRTGENLVKSAINILLLFAAAIAVVYLVIGGFQYVAARGNEEATEKAKKTITGSIIGLVVIVMAFAIVTIISSLLTKAPGVNAPAGTQPQDQPGQPPASPAAFNFTDNTGGIPLQCPINNTCNRVIGVLSGGTKTYIPRSGTNGLSVSQVEINADNGEVIIKSLSSDTEVAKPYTVTFWDSSQPTQAISITFTVNFSPASAGRSL